MKKKLAIINFILMLTVVGAMLFQSIHSYEHLEEELSVKECLHNLDGNKSVITHHHHHLDNCFVCEFTFAHFISPDIQSFSFARVAIATKYTFTYSREITQFFRGSLFSLRGPPDFIA